MTIHSSLEEQQHRVVGSTWLEVVENRVGWDRLLVNHMRSSISRCSRLGNLAHDTAVFEGQHVVGDFVAFDERMHTQLHVVHLAMSLAQ